jgi:multiple sugar transport system permease protein
VEQTAVGLQRGPRAEATGKVAFRRGEANLGILLVAPVVLLVAVFTLYPFAHAIYQSFQLSIPILPEQFVGLDNYSEVIFSPYFVDSLRATITLGFLAGPLTDVLALLVAWLLNEKFFGNTVLRAGMLLPWAIPASATGAIWKWMFLDSWGALNALLYTLGIIQQYISWLTTPPLAVGVVILAFVWSQMPLAAILLLAAVQAVPDDLYEAAAIDGAGPFGRFRHITLPGVGSTLLVVALYELLMGLTNFDIPYSLTHGGPGTATTVVSYFTWSEGFKTLNYGHGSALSIMIGLAALVVIFGIVRLVPKGIMSARNR